MSFNHSGLLEWGAFRWTNWEPSAKGGRTLKLRRAQLVSTGGLLDGQQMHLIIIKNVPRFLHWLKKYPAINCVMASNWFGWNNPDPNVGISKDRDNERIRSALSKMELFDPKFASKFIFWNALSADWLITNKQNIFRQNYFKDSLS